MRRCHQFPQHILYRAASIALIFLSIGLMLVACSSNTTTGGQPTPPPVAINCGNIHSSHSQLAPAEKANIQKAENCFYQAYRQCRPATLMFTAFGIDTGAIHHFSIKGANGACSVSDSVQHYIAPNPPGAATMYTCSTMSQQRDGLHMQACGGLGAIVIPLV